MSEYKPESVADPYFVEARALKNEINTIIQRVNANHWPDGNKEGIVKSLEEAIAGLESDAADIRDTYIIGEPETKKKAPKSKE